jgi:hypothetical protein
MPDEDLINLLPRRLRTRFEGLGGYVGSILEEEMSEHKLSTEALQLVQFVAFVGALDQFLRGGTRAATQAVDLFAELGIKGFRIGSETFAERNEAVMRGTRLSEALRDTIDDQRLILLLTHETPIRSLVLRCARILTNG